MKTAKRVTTVVIIGTILSVLSFAPAGVYGGGSGTEADPYQIAAPAHWQELMARHPDWGSSFVLTADLDLQGVDLTPLGYEGIPFMGVFDGAGFVIRNARMELPISDNVGLWGYIGPAGRIQAVALENVIVTGRNRVGGLCGWNSGLIRGCRVSGRVAAMGEVGGLCGWNVGQIQQCCVTGSATGESRSIGGLCGTTLGGIRDCYASNAVVGYKYIGGLCGTSSNGAVERCYAAGKVTGTENVGGLFGKVDFTTASPVSACFWDQQTTGQPNASGSGLLDGAAGKTTALMKTPATFTDAGWDFSETDGDAADWWLPENSYPRLAWEMILSFSPDAGTYWGTQQVAIHCSTPAATIHYSINGDEPTQNDPVIASDATLPISQSLTLKAKAWHSGFIASETKSAAYAIKRVCPAGDLNGDCKVDMRDFAILSQWWLQTCDITNNWCNGVDLDLSGVIDLGELEDVTADILDEEPVISHVKEFTIQVMRDYGDEHIQQVYGKNMTYVVYVSNQTDGSVTGIEFTTPAGKTVTMSSASYVWRESYPDGLLSGGRGMLGPDWYLWEYEYRFFNADSLADYGDGYYDFTIHYADGGTQQTSVWFGIPDTEEPIPTPTQIPTFTTIANGVTYSSPVTFNWQPCIDPAVQYIGMGVVYGDFWSFEDATPTGLDAPVPLSAGEHHAWIYFESYYNYDNEDGINVGIGKHNQSHYQFKVN